MTWLSRNALSRADGLDGDCCMVNPTVDYRGVRLVFREKLQPALTGQYRLYHAVASETFAPALAEFSLSVIWCFDCGCRGQSTEVTLIVDNSWRKGIDGLCWGWRLSRFCSGCLPRTYNAPPIERRMAGSHFTHKTAVQFEEKSQKFGLTEKESVIYATATGAL